MRRKCIKLQNELQRASIWCPIDASASYIEHWVYLTPWQRTMRVLIYRKRVAHETAKNFQLDLFDQNDGRFEYSAIATIPSMQFHANNYWPQFSVLAFKLSGSWQGTPSDYLGLAVDVQVRRRNL